MPTELKEVIKADVRRASVNVPDYVIEAAIHNGCRRFFSDSEVWIEPQSLDAEGRRIAVTALEPDVFVCGVAEVRTKHERSIAFTWQGGQVCFERDIDALLDVDLVLCPTNTSIPTWAYEQHKEAFVHAAVRDLKSQQGQPWFDPEGAGYHEGEYRHHLGIARIQSMPKYIAPNPFV
ncbi:MAG: hypothetical protein WCF45_10615 [Photobacterium halotolerans]